MSNEQNKGVESVSLDIRDLKIRPDDYDRDELSKKMAEQLKPAVEDFRNNIAMFAQVMGKTKLMKYQIEMLKQLNKFVPKNHEIGRRIILPLRPTRNPHLMNDYIKEMREEMAKSVGIDYRFLGVDMARTGSDGTVITEVYIDEAGNFEARKPKYIQQCGRFLRARTPRKLKYKNTLSLKQFLRRFK